MPRNGYQVDGAPNDEVTLTAVHGFAFDFGGLEGDNTFYIDDVVLKEAAAE